MLKDGKPEISNNRAERSIKLFAVGRKIFLSANILKGAIGSAIMFRLIQIMIENVHEQYKYPTWLLKTANNAKL